MQQQQLKVKWSEFYETYDAETVEAAVPEEISGVYLLWVKLDKPAGHWKVIYVGKAVDLRDRLLKHLSDKEPNRCLKENIQKYVCGFEYAPISTEQNRSGAERYIYDHFKGPECNEITPPGNPIPVNLPVSST